MTVPSGFMVILLVIAGLLPIGLLLQVSNWMHSRFRNNLWNLRDELVDDLLQGDIQVSPGSIRLLLLIETHIRNSKRHTFTDVVVAVAVTRKVEIPSITDAISGPATPEPDRAALLRYFDSFRMANFHHLLASSPSGWLAWCLLNVRRVVTRVIPQEFDDNPRIRKQVVRVELKAIPEMTPPPQSPVRRGPLLDEPAVMV